MLKGRIAYKKSLQVGGEISRRLLLVCPLHAEDAFKTSRSFPFILLHNTIVYYPWVNSVKISPAFQSNCKPRNREKSSARIKARSCACEHFARFSLSNEIRG